MSSFIRHKLLVICQYAEQGAELISLFLGPVIERAFSISNFCISPIGLGQLCDTFDVVF